MSNLVARPVQSVHVRQPRRYAIANILRSKEPIGAAFLPRLGSLASPHSLTFHAVMPSFALICYIISSRRSGLCFRWRGNR